MAKVTVLGAGAFGTSVAALLAHNDHDVMLWALEEEVAQEVERQKTNSRYLAGVHLPRGVKATSDIAIACQHSPFLFQAIPVSFLRKTLSAALPSCASAKTWISLSKGIEQGTHLFPTQIIQELFGADHNVVAMSGPNFARELATGVPSAATVACTNIERARDVAKLLSGPTFKPYISSDLMGTQVSGALKNVVTLAVGIVSGAGYAENTRAFVFTAGLNELGMLATHCKGKKESVFELCGVGDLVLTSMGSQSRNLRCGQLIGEGKTLDVVRAELGILPEGVNTVRSMHELCEKHDLNFPVSSAVYDVLFNGMKPEQLVEKLMKWDGEWCYTF